MHYLIGHIEGERGSGQDDVSRVFVAHRGLSWLKYDSGLYCSFGVVKVVYMTQEWTGPCMV